MKIAVIADDLTGANDTGVQLVKSGLSTSVFISDPANRISLREAVVFDTDSRSVSGAEAYRRVKVICERIRVQERCDLVYKKIDSTLRGNIGSEMDAVYDAFLPDFIVVAPSFPKLGRVVRNGQLFVNGVPIHQTDMVKDPKNPITTSSLCELIEMQTDRPTALITMEQLGEGEEKMLLRLKRLRQDNIPYLLFDAETESGLQRIVSLFNRTDYQVIWSGSAALANELSARSFDNNPPLSRNAPSPGPALIAVGSVNSRSRQQLQALLQLSSVIGIEMRSDAVLTEETKIREIKRVEGLARNAFLSERKDVVIYSSGLEGEVEKTQLLGRKLGMDDNQVSNDVSNALGEAAAIIIQSNDVRNLILTGGDTAKQVCLHLGAEEIELIEELEPGVPIGKLSGKGDIYVITKAGGFGNEAVLVHSLEFFRGGANQWFQSLE